MDEFEQNPNDNTVILKVPGKAGRTVKPGDVIGQNYRLTQLIGLGGMGIVYRCRHLIIGQDYALKILSADQVNEQTWQRFQVEGKAIAKLDHPNIVKIFNMGVDRQDCPYYVMELLNGDSLETLIERQGALSPETTLEIFAQVAAGLNYAHKSGIVHRDIKPSNIMLQRDGGDKYTVKIVDFGLAKLVDRHNPASQSLTSAGEVIGSPFYMSPEQGLGTGIDARSDIYSMGCTIFKTLTGKPPFSGESAFQTIMMHQNQMAPTLSSAIEGKEFPPALEDLVHKMLAKRPEERYQSMDQISHDLGRLQQGKTLTKTSGIDRAAAADQETDERFPDHQSLLKTHGAIIATAFLVVISLAAVAFVILTRSPPTGTTGSALVKPAKTADQTSNLEHKEATPSSIEHDSEMDAAIASFTEFKPKDTETFTENGQKYRRMYFPSTAVGMIAEGSNPGKQAKDTIVFTADGTIRLSIGVKDHRFTWAHPWILKKIDKNDVNIFALNVDSKYVELTDGLIGKDVSEKSILEMLEIARTWHSLEGVVLGNCPISPKILSTVKDFGHVVDLQVSGTSCSVKVLAQYKEFLAHLKRLDIDSTKDVDSVLFAVAHSNKIITLIIDETDPSPEALAALSGCPKLAYLSMERVAIKPQHLAAIGHLSHLKDLNLGHYAVDPDQLMLLPCLKNIGHLTLSRENWTSAQTNKLKGVLTKTCVVTDARPSEPSFAKYEN